MDLKSIFSWIAMFIILTGFTVLAVKEIFTKQTALAKTIAQEFAPGELTNDDTVLVVDSQTEDSRLQRRLNFMARADWEICQISPEQLDLLDNEYHITQQTATVNGSDINLVKIDPHRITDGRRLNFVQLKWFLERTSGHRLNCHVAHTNKFLYLLFNGKVS